MNARAELGREAEAILYAGGFRNAAAKHHGPFWTVYGVFAGNEHSGATHKQADPQDPRELARVLVARVQAEPDVIADELEAPETVEETFAPGQGPFDAPPHVEPPEPIVDNIAEERHEGDGETSAQTESEASVEVRGPDWSEGETPERNDNDADARSDDDGSGDFVSADPPEPIDADYLEANQLDDYSLGAEIEDADAEAAGAYIFGDNLEQKRTAAIGLVIRHALERLPPLTPEDDAHLSELRNFAMGVSEGRWPNEAGKQAELEELELTYAIARHVEAARDGKVAYLMAATREQIEAFDPAAGWPT